MSMRKESGFTLIETVIALALLTLLGAAFLTVSDAGRRLLEIGRRLEKLDDEAARAAYGKGAEAAVLEGRGGR